jgi:hypothetical protein
MDVTEMGCKNVEWIHLAQDRNRLLVLLKVVIHFEVSKKTEIYWVAERTVSF